MTTVKHHKVVAALPTVLEPNAIYYVRAGSGFDQYVTNGAGLVVASPLNADVRSKLLDPSGLPAIRPSLRLDFLNCGDRLDPRITFTRASGGGRFNAQGIYEWLPANQPRIDYDPVTGECRGLLIEEQRTNLLLRSTMVGNSPAPDGWSSSALGGTPIESTYGVDSQAWKFTSSSSRNFVSTVTAVSAGATYSFSVLVESNPNGLITKDLILPVGLPAGATYSFPQGDTHVPVAGRRTYFNLSVGSTAGGVQFRVGTGCDGNVTGTAVLSRPQLEQGAFPTSYIPTAGAQVTRAADVASVNELSPWFNASEGTVVFSVNTLHSGVRVAATLSDGGLNNRVQFAAVPGSRSAAVVSGGIVQCDLYRVLDGKAALSFAENNFRFSVGGRVPATDTSGTVPVVNQLRLGAYPTNSGYLNGHIEFIRVYPRAFPEAVLQALTA